MAGKLKNATDRCEFLEKERRAEQEDLKKATAEAKDARSAMRAIKEELRQARDITAGKPFLLQRKFTDPKYAQLSQLWGAEDAYLDLRRVPQTRSHTSGAKRITEWKSFFGRNSIVRSVHFH